MPNFNRVILMGNLTRDPELRHTPSGHPVTDFRMAINRRRRNADGERRDETAFVDVTAWGRAAELIGERVVKSEPLFVEGHLSLDQWTARDGQKHSKLRVVVERFQFLTPPRRRPAEAPSDSAPGPPEREEGPPDR